MVIGVCEAAKLFPLVVNPKGCFLSGTSSKDRNDIF